MSVSKDLTLYPIASENEELGTRNVRARFLARFNDGLSVASSLAPEYRAYVDYSTAGSICGVDYYNKALNESYVFTVTEDVNGGAAQTILASKKIGVNGAITEDASLTIPSGTDLYLRYTHCFFLPMPEYDATYTNYYLVLIANTVFINTYANDGANARGTYIYVYKVDFEASHTNRFSLVNTYAPSSFVNSYLTNNKVERAFFDEFSGSIFITTPQLRTNVFYSSQTQIATLDSEGALTVRNFNTQFTEQFTCNSEFVVTIQSDKEVYPDGNSYTTKRIFFYKRDQNETTGYILHRLYDYLKTNAFPNSNSMLDISWCISNDLVKSISLSSKNYITFVMFGIPGPYAKIFVVNLWDYTVSYTFDPRIIVSSVPVEFAYYDEVTERIYFASNTVLYHVNGRLNLFASDINDNTVATFSDIIDNRKRSGFIFRRGALIGFDFNSIEPIYNISIGGGGRLATLYGTRCTVLYPDNTTPQYSDVHGFILK